MQVKIGNSSSLRRDPEEKRGRKWSGHQEGGEERKGEREEGGGRWRTRGQKKEKEINEREGDRGGDQGEKGKGEEGGDQGEKGK